MNSSRLDLRAPDTLDRLKQTKTRPCLGLHDVACALKGTPLYNRKKSVVVSSLFSSNVEGGMALMNRMRVGTALIGLAWLLVTAGCASKEAAMQPTSAGPSVSPATTEAVPEGPSDFLNACLAKISNDSSDGARMVAEQSCQDNDKLHQDLVGTAVAKSGNRASAGTQGDSHEACITRIPTDATAGQRMLAEESCKRDQLMHH